MHRMTWTVMGCQAAILLDTPSTQQELALEQIPTWLRQWEVAFDKVHPESEIAHLNHANGQPLRVSGALWSLLRTAMAGAELSDGLVLPLIPRTRATDQGRMARTRSADWRAIQLDPFTSSVTLPPESCLDLYYLQHAWAATMLVRKLADYGPVFVDIGGTIALSGPIADGSAWPIEIADPQGMQRQLAQVHLSSGSLVTLQTIPQPTTPANGAMIVIDPRTGAPAQSDLIAVTIIAPDAISATIAARTMLVLGSQAGIPWLEAQPNYAALLVKQDGQWITNQRMASVFTAVQA